MLTLLKSQIQEHLDDLTQRVYVDIKQKMREQQALQQPYTIGTMCWTSFPLSTANQAWRKEDNEHNSMPPTQPVQKDTMINVIENFWEVKKSKDSMLSSSHSCQKSSKGAINAISDLNNDWKGFR